MNFLLTNDDGVDAIGLATLRRAVEGLGTAVIVAPDVHYSGCSHQTTTDRPLELKQLEPGRFELNGTPADCVRVGLLHVMPDADWVLSGINDGANLGVDIYMSGTVAAAREAALLSRPAIALSHYRTGRFPIGWELAQQMARRVLPELFAKDSMPGGYWNVNFPHLKDGQLPDVVYCDADPCPLPVRFEQQGGQFRYRGRYHDRDRRPGHDVDVCFSGRIAVTMVERTLC